MSVSEPYGTGSATFASKSASCAVWLVWPLKEIFFCATITPPPSRRMSCALSVAFASFTMVSTLENRSSCKKRGATRGFDWGGLCAVVLLDGDEVCCARAGWLKWNERATANPHRDTAVVATDTMSLMASSLQALRHYLL